MKKLILIITLIISAITANAQFIPTVPYIAYNPTDSTLSVFNPTTGAWRQLEKIQVVASNITTNPAKIQIWQNTSASGALTQNMPGIELFPLAQNNTTNIYTPAIKFGSADPDLGFPTGKAKFLAGIIGRATQVYSGTTSGGMSMDMLVSKNTPGGATTVPTVGMNIGYGATVVTGTVGLQSTAGAGTDSVALISSQVIKRVKQLALGQIDTTFATGLSPKYERISYKTATQSSSTNMYPNWAGVTNYALPIPTGGTKVNGSVVQNTTGAGLSWSTAPSITGGDVLTWNGSTWTSKTIIASAPLSWNATTSTMSISGVPIIQSSANLTAQTTAGNITTFTVGASTATFNVSAYINITAVATDVIQAQVTYTDENNTAQTVSFTTLSTVSNSTYSPITIRAKNGTVITLKTNLTTGVGSITFDAGGSIVQN